MDQQKMAKACVGIFKFLLKLSCDVCSCGYGACSSKELAEGKSYYEINLLGKKCEIRSIPFSEQFVHMVLQNCKGLSYIQICKILIKFIDRYEQKIMIDARKSYDNNEAIGKTIPGYEPQVFEDIYPMFLPSVFFMMLILRDSFKFVVENIHKFSMNDMHKHYMHERNQFTTNPEY